MQDFEKLGVFYLGRRFDADTGKAGAELVLYDSKDLVTHAVCVGMTGSGKTGLCLTLIEEAAIDGIPALVIDPKGDLPNLLLTFPELRAEDFRPWVNERDATQRGLSADEFAAQQAEQWKQGLADWGQDGERIRRLREAANFSVFTPGSSAGRPLSMLKRFAAPPPEQREDAELLAEQIATAASGLLALAGIDADPIQSREHILLCTLLRESWLAGRDLDLATIIAQIQAPPVKQVGVLELESFYPAKERFGLAMRLNNLLAAPGFSAWLEGEPLDVERLLHTPDGKPRISIFSIAHLDDAQRMFFVTTLLNQVVGWMRSQPGTTSLRALVYMDEIFGYFPPVANPPSKLPLLTLLKQARAFGVGVVLATQNPVDLDYKGLSNAGTWFVGRLQTERDQLRVLDGLEGVAASSGAAFDRARLQKLLAGLQSRVFLLNNVHEDAPVLFQVRWALSYLRGPVTREQIRRLMDNRRGPAHGADDDDALSDTPGTPPAATQTPGAPAAPAPSGQATPVRPGLDPEIAQYFLPPSGEQAAGTVVYRPLLVGVVNVHYAQAKANVEYSEQVAYAVAVQPSGVAIDWQQSGDYAWEPDRLLRDPAAGATFAPLATTAAQAKSYKGWQKSLVDYVYRTRRLTLWQQPTLKLISRPDETEGAFRIRLQQAIREQRDQRVEQLRAEYGPRVLALEEKAKQAETALERERSEANQKRVESVFSAGAAILGMILGRKRLSASNVQRAGTASRSAGKVFGTSRDVEKAELNVDQIRERRTKLEAEFRAETEALLAEMNTLEQTVETVAIKPKKVDITISQLALVWKPDPPSEITSATVAPENPATTDPATAGLPQP
ncbi:MAG: ATP-binding protein [Pirellulales bacterium]|nr:ATP-binding protein [Pirellulales bacterium]